MPTSNTVIPYGRQQIGEDDIEAVAAVMRGDFLTTGPMVERFERALCETVGSEFAVACANGTAALHLAALALGLGPGDSVVVPAVTFLATANAARYVGAEVIFADVDSETGLLHAHHLADAIARNPSARIRAAFPVSLGGQCTDMAEICELARKHGFQVVHDACHALGTSHEVAGTTYRMGDGSHGSLYTFSFHPVKTIAMGEGGALTTNDSHLCEKLLRLRNHGMTRDPESFQNPELGTDAQGEPNPWYYEMPEVGFNYRVPDILCALGVSQLSKLESFAAKRRRLADRYAELLAPLTPEVQIVPRVPGCNPVLHLLAVLIDFDAIGRSRREVMQDLYNKGIGTQVHYIPVPYQPYYTSRYGHGHFPGAHAYYSRELSLPLHTGMSLEDVDRVVESLTTVVRNQQ